MLNKYLNNNIIIITKTMIIIIIYQDKNKKRHVMLYVKQIFAQKSLRQTKPRRTVTTSPRCFDKPTCKATSKLCSSALRAKTALNAKDCHKDGWFNLVKLKEIRSLEHWLLADSLWKQKSNWILTINSKMNVWKCKLIFPTYTLQEKIGITDLKPFLTGENTSGLGL